MYIGTNPFTPEYQNDEGYEVLDLLLDKFAAWSKDLWIYDQTGTTNVETVIGMTRYCAKELKVNHIFIDSLMKVVGSEEDMTGQKMLVAELFSIAKDHNVHIHLIHHVRKPANENVVPDKYDLKGRGSISDQVDNVFTVFRNKAKEDDVRNNGKFGTKAAEFDSILKCCKQRHYEGSGDGEPTIALWLHRDSGQFIGQAHDPRLPASCHLKKVAYSNPHNNPALRDRCVFCFSSVYKSKLLTQLRNKKPCHFRDRVCAQNRNRTCTTLR
jgi:twinkle protein